MGEWKDWLEHNHLWAVIGMAGQPIQRAIDVVGGWSTLIGLIVGAAGAGMYWAWQQHEMLNSVTSAVVVLKQDKVADEERCRRLQIDFGSTSEKVDGLAKSVGHMEIQVEQAKDRLSKVEAEANLHERKDEERFRRGR